MAVLLWSNHGLVTVDRLVGRVLTSTRKHCSVMLVNFVVLVCCVVMLPSTPLHLQVTIAFATVAVVLQVCKCKEVESALVAACCALDWKMLSTYQRKLLWETDGLHDACLAIAKA